MKVLTTITAILIATFSACVIAEQELSLTELDSVVASSRFRGPVDAFTSSARAEAVADGFGPNLILETIASAETGPAEIGLARPGMAEMEDSSPMTSSSFAQSISIANGASRFQVASISTRGTATGAGSRSESRTYAFVDYDAGISQSWATQTSTASGAFSSAESSSQAVSVVSK
ncbi:hypothetical protein [Thiocapsa imhoffii]|uniref:hypothetical protein n=1 Tax=Thiocapsa imhoffii TaxID=382777 RepID=UPI00190642CE|nr:hypothetical protein [Thiocapsa imhoffii]